MFLIGPYSFPAGTLLAALQRLGLTNNLQVCLDAGAAASYDGSSQTWTDLSGNGNHFYRGTTSGSDATDPTFNGTSGNQTSSEYFSYDGGDRFKLSIAIPAWQSAMHQPGAVFTMLQWAYVGNLTALAPSQAGFGCGDAVAAADGRFVSFSNSASTQNALSIGITNDTVAAFGNKSTILVTNNAWQMVAVSVDTGGNAINFAVNGTTETRSSAQSQSLTSTASPSPLVIGAAANDGTASAINGCRIAATAIWSRALSTTELTNIFTATRARFGV